MPVVLRFASSSNANGLQALAFERSSQGLGLFFNFREQVTVAGDHALFNAISAPGEFAFRLDSAVGSRWRSGRQVLSASPTDTFLILPAGTLTFTPAALAAMLPAPPIMSGAATITSITLTLGTGSITATGTGTYASMFGTIPVTFTYVFTLVPVTEPANMGFPGTVASPLDVMTISATVVATAGGALGFLVNFFAGILFGLMAGTIRATLELAVQRAIDGAMAGALASKGAPAGTIATVETVSITPTALTMVPFAGLALEKACASSSSGGSVNLRPQAHLIHLREIRDRMLRCSPQGLEYISLFEQFNSELATLLLRDEKLLRAADAIVSLVLREFPIEDPGSGQMSQKLAAAVIEAMSLVETAASPELKMTVAALRPEVEQFVDRPAREVLDASFRLLERPPRQSDS